MIWLTKLLKNVDGFYTQASKYSELTKLAETPEEAKERRRKKMLEDAEREDKEIAQQEKQVEEQKIKESAGRKALEKVNEWGDSIVNDDLFKAFQQYMLTYVEIFTIINDLNPNIVGEALNAAKEQLDSSDDELEELKTEEDKIAQLCHIVDVVLPMREAALAALPYLTKKKSKEDAATEPEDESWVEDFSASEFIDAIKLLSDDCRTTTETILKQFDVNINQMAGLALQQDEAKPTNQEGEGLEQAFQAGMTPTGPKYEQTLAAIRRYKAACRAALKIGPMDPHWQSAQLYKDKRKEYEAALKADPARLARRKTVVAKGNKLYRERLAQKQEIMEEWKLATTPQEKDYVRRKAKRLLETLTFSRGYHQESTREIESRIESMDPIQEMLEGITRRQKSIKTYQAKKQQQIEQGRVRKAYVDLLDTFRKALATRKNEAKKGIKNEGINLEHTFFDEPRETLKKVTASLLKAKAEGYPALAVARLERELEAAKKNLATAMSNWKDQQPSVLAVSEQLKYLYSFRDLVVSMLDEGLISDMPIVLEPDKEDILKQKVTLLDNLINQYVSSYKLDAAATQAKQILEKIMSGLSTESVAEEVITEEPLPTMPEPIKEASMNRKARRNILQKIAKEAKIESALLKTSQLEQPSTTNYDQAAEEYTHKVFLELAEQLWGDAAMAADDGQTDDS